MGRRHISRIRARKVFQQRAIDTYNIILFSLWKTQNVYYIFKKIGLRDKYEIYIFRGYKIKLRIKNNVDGTDNMIRIKFK